jgi:hypothetical protein
MSLPVTASLFSINSMLWTLWSSRQNALDRAGFADEGGADQAQDEASEEGGGADQTQV